MAEGNSDKTSRSLSREAGLKRKVTSPEDSENQRDYQNKERVRKTRRTIAHIVLAASILTSFYVHEKDDSSQSLINQLNTLKTELEQIRDGDVGYLIENDYEQVVDDVLVAIEELQSLISDESGNTVRAGNLEEAQVLFLQIQEKAEVFQHSMQLLLAQLENTSESVTNFLDFMTTSNSEMSDELTDFTQTLIEAREVVQSQLGWYSSMFRTNQTYINQMSAALEAGYLDGFNHQIGPMSMYLRWADPTSHYHEGAETNSRENISLLLESTATLSRFQNEMQNSKDMTEAKLVIYFSLLASVLASFRYLRTDLKQWKSRREEMVTEKERFEAEQKEREKRLALLEASETHISMPSNRNLSRAEQRLVDQSTDAVILGSDDDAEVVQNN